MFYRKNKGFTLIELLIVIFIIGILASIVLVLISSAKNKAKKSSVQSSLGSIVSAGVMCRDGGGTIQGGDGGDNICNPASIINSTYPSIEVCGSNAVDTQFTVDQGDSYDWQIILSNCGGASGFTDCNDSFPPSNAYCDSNGCHFPVGGTCH